MLIFENVASIAFAQHARTLAFLFSELRRRRLHFRFRVIDSSKHGALTSRTRLILVASRSARTMRLFSWPARRTHREKSAKCVLLAAADVPEEVWSACSTSKRAVFVADRLRRHQIVRSRGDGHVHVGRDTYSSLYTARLDRRDGSAGGTVTGSSSRGIPGAITASVRRGEPTQPTQSSFRAY
jgi:site-specific DNA-cytosine methylase